MSRLRPPLVSVRLHNWLYDRSRAYRRWIIRRIFR